MKSVWVFILEEESKEMKEDTQEKMKRWDENDLQMI